MMSKDFMPKAFMPKVFVLEKTFNAFRSTGASAAGQAIFGAFLLLGLGFSPAQAETNIPTVAEYVMVTEFETGRVLMEKGKDVPMKPASMAKIMTAMWCSRELKMPLWPLRTKSLFLKKPGKWAVLVPF